MSQKKANIEKTKKKDIEKSISTFSNLIERENREIEELFRNSIYYCDYEIENLINRSLVIYQTYLSMPLLRTSKSKRTSSLIFLK